MDDLFKHPLWMMWKYAYPKEEDKVRRDVQQTMYDNKTASLDDDDVERKMPEVETLERAK